MEVVRLGTFLSHDRSALNRALSYLSFGLAALLVLPFLRVRPRSCYVYNLVTLIPAALLARRLWKTRIIFDVQDLWPESVASSGMMRATWLLGLIRQICRAAYRNPDLVVAQSPGFRRRLLERGVSADRLRVIFNWTREDVTAQSNDESSAESFRVVYTGNIGVMQGLDVVLRAAAKLRFQRPAVRFIFAGTGIEADRLQRAAEGLPNVEFLGWMPPSEIGPLVESAGALLLHLRDDPLFRDTIPSKLQAYLFAGRPILCGVYGDAAQVVAEADAGLSFNPDDEDALVRAVDQLMLTSNQERKAMGARGRAFYDRQMSQRSGLASFAKLLLADNR